MTDPAADHRALAALATFSLLLGLVSVAAPVAGRPTPLTNLAHLDFLGDAVTPPSQADHTTYRLARSRASASCGPMPSQTDGCWRYRRLGGGTYDPDTNTYGQGAFNTDDLTEGSLSSTSATGATFGDAHSRDAAYGLLRA